VSDFAQWTSVLGGGIVFLTALEVSYAMVDWACGSDNAWALHLVYLVTLALTVGAGMLGWSLWTRIGREPPDGGPGSVARSRFLAAIGALGGVIFSLVILAQWIMVVVLGPCSRH
jgi:hypothetical protein